MEKLNYYKLTNAQQNIFEVEQTLLTANNACNVLLVSVKFDIDLDYFKLEKTLNKIIELNDSFRIKLIKRNSTIKQYVDEYKYQKIDLINIDTKKQFEQYIEHLKETAIIDIYNKLYEFKIVKYNKQTYIMYKVHHIINDAWGMTQVAEQIKQIYPIIEKDNLLNKLEKPTYIDVIEKDEKYNNSDKYKTDQQFWQEYVKKLSVEKIFNKDISDTQATRYSTILDEKIYKDVKKYCEDNSISEYTFFLAIITIYFYKIYNVESLNIGTPFLNRSKKEFENIGLFVSNLPLNVQLKQEDIFINICEEIYRTNFKIFRHSKFPYTEIQKIYSDINSVSNMFEIGFSYQINTLKNEIENDLGETNWYFTNQQNNPITIHLSQMNGKLDIYYDYVTSILNENEIEEIHNIILHVIKQVIEQKNIKIKDINVITEKEKTKLIAFNNTGNLDISNRTLADVIDEICKKYANNIAIKYKTKEIKYKDFYKKVCELAQFLRNQGVKRNTPVVLLFDKSMEMIISMFAVIKAGGYYIPILPQENKERIKYILSDCNPSYILTSHEYKEVDDKKNVIIVDEKKLGLNTVKVNNINSNEDLAYVIYTSGSTGNPKGTKIMHKNIHSLLNSMNSDINLNATSNDVSMSLLKYSFDASGIDIYSAILNGGKLVLISKEDELNPNKIVQIMKNEKVTRSFLVPKWLEHINDADKEENTDLSSLRILGTGGESFKPKVVENLYNKYPNLKILNLYGPTEATMFATYTIVNRDNIEENSISIGKPIKYGRALIINSFGDIVPTNTKGELILYEDNKSIKNLAAGYLNLKNVTETKFKTINNVLTNESIKVYKTGDIAKINDNLEIEYIGRADDVVKVNNGYLVSINEIEARINKIIGNKYEFYVTDINTSTTKSLILFVKENNEKIDTQLLKKHINSQISFYMRIKDIITIKTFPQNNSGKIDKKQLKYIAENKLNQRELIMPQTNTEKQLYNIIKNQCKIEEFSIKDDIIDDLGIDSLNMTVIYSLINNNKIKMQDLYTYTTIQSLAKLIDNQIENTDRNLIKKVEIKNNVTKFDIKNILLTGSTGFLGIHILIELIKNKDVKKVYCIVRNKENISSEDRLYNKINYYFDNLNKEMQTLIKEKIEVLDGDIAKENFGLNVAVYNELKNKITTVVNSAANVRHYGKFEKFYQTNVDSINNIIAFCSEKISLAHISTLSIAGFKEDKTENCVFDENLIYIKQTFNNNPYLLTKFYAEQEILESNTNAKIFRIGNIMPRVSDGRFQDNYNQNAFISAIRLMMKLGKIPKDYLRLKVEFSPVDECAVSIVELIQMDCKNNIYHIVNENETYIKEIVEVLDNDKIEIVNKAEFIKNLNNYDEIGSEYIKEYILQNNLNQYSVERTIKNLESVGFRWSKINQDYIKNIIKIIEEKRW